MRELVVMTAGLLGIRLLVWITRRLVVWLGSRCPRMTRHETALSATPNFSWAAGGPSASP